MTIGVPIITCLHRVRRIHEAIQTKMIAWHIRWDVDVVKDQCSNKKNTNQQCAEVVQRVAKTLSVSSSSGMARGILHHIFH